jgi:hypothetical protein
MNELAEQVFESVKRLPDDKIMEVLDFVEFIRQRTEAEARERRERAEALRAVFREIQDLPQAKILTEEDIAAEIAAYRAERECKTSGS